MQKTFNHIRNIIHYPMVTGQVSGHQSGIVEAVASGNDVQVAANRQRGMTGALLLASWYMGELEDKRVHFLARNRQSFEQVVGLAERNFNSVAYRKNVTFSFGDLPSLEYVDVLIIDDFIYSPHHDEIEALFSSGTKRPQIVLGSSVDTANWSDTHRFLPTNLIRTLDFAVRGEHA